VATTFSRTGTAYCRKSAFPESNGTVSFKEMTISLGADSMKISLSKPISLTKRCVLLEKPELCRSRAWSFRTIDRIGGLVCAERDNLLYVAMDGASMAWGD